MTVKDDVLDVRMTRRERELIRARAGSQTDSDYARGRLLASDDVPALRAGEVVAGYLAEHHKAPSGRRNQALQDFTHLVRTSNPLLTRALQHQATADNAGVVPQPIEDG